MTRKKILILHISEFGGHSKAAQNIKEAIHYKYQDITAWNLNGFQYFYSYLEQVVNFFYTITIKHFPAVWGRLYDRKNVVKTLLPVRGWVNFFAFEKLKQLVSDYNPACVVATQAFPCGIFADYKRRTGSQIPLIAVVTDYHPHRFWIHPNVDQYVVACLEAKNFLINEGVSPDKIKILGIPISVKFLEKNDTEVTSKEFGFRPDIPSVLVMGGGLGMGPIKKIAKQLDDLRGDFQIIVVCGRNRLLYKWFVKNKPDFKKKLFHFGYTEGIPKLMDFCDIIITKGGGITVSEALAKGLALVITEALPGQEERNVKYLLEQGAIVEVDDPENIGSAVQELIDDKERLLALKTKAKEISFIDSSLKIVDLILSQIK